MDMVSVDTWPLSNSPLIAMAFVATHNHFVLDRGGKVFKQSAPVIKLPEGSSAEDHLVVLGLVNSSTACFWLKQVLSSKPNPGDDLWQLRFEFDATKLQLLPLPDGRPPIELSATLDALATQLSGCQPAAVCGTSTHEGSPVRS